MAGKWTDLLSALHTVLRSKRWQRFLLAVLFGSAIALAGFFPFAQHTSAQPSPSALFEQGQQQYQAGQYAEAVESLEAAIARFESQNQFLQQAIALSNLGLTYQALGQWDAAEAAVFQALDVVEWPIAALHTMSPPQLSPEALAIVASALNIYGKGLLQSGNAVEALTVWQQASQLYRNLQNTQGKIASNINQLQALQSLGLFQQASMLGEQLRDTIEAQANPVTQIKGLLNLGNIERAIGHLDKHPQNDNLDEASGSLATLFDALEIAQTIDEPELLSDVHLSLGATYQALGDRETERQVTVNRQGLSPWVCLITETPESAKPYYQSALSQYQAAANHPSNQVAAGLNELRVLKALNQWDNNTADAWQQLRMQLEAMLPSRNQVYGQIMLAKQGACLQQFHETAAISWEDIQSVLMRAVAIAQSLKDSAAESYARGNLGGLYEYFSALNASSQIKANADVALTWRDAARELTQQALLLAQPTEFPEIAFQWQWQLARLDRRGGNWEAAIADYQNAIQTLDAARSNLITINSDVQFSFRDNIEPIYRELVDLLLKSDTPTDRALEEAITVIDALQLSELENYLQCSLAVAQLTEESVDPNAATLYGIVLKDRVEMILRRPDGVLLNHKYRSQQSDLESFLAHFQANLKAPSRRQNAKEQASELYTGLIHPFDNALEADIELEHSNVKMLSLVLDGKLRSLPISTLYDDKRDRYLVERYAIAYVPSLNLVEPAPLSRNPNILAGGITHPVRHPLRENDTFPGLENVNLELDSLQELFPGTILLDEQLSLDEFQAQLTKENYAIVHLATHGEFSSDPERTFVMLSDVPLYAKELDELLRSRHSSIEMLVLSACKTATGDKRAALGLAGLTIRAGTRSTLATLWAVQDESAAILMQSFYRNLKDKPEITRAEALRRAQVQLLEDESWKNPLHWSPYVLVGNWL